MSARLKMVLAAFLASFVLVGCSSLNPWDEPTLYDLVVERQEALENGELCLVYNDEGESDVVTLSDDDEYVAADDSVSYPTLTPDFACMTQAEVDKQAELEAEAEAEQAALAAQEVLVEADKACHLASHEIVEYDDEYVAQDRRTYCLTQAEVEADNRLTANIVSDVEAIEADSWQQRASAVVDLYCGIDQLPVMTDNYSEVMTSLVEAYEGDRTYSGNDYPYTFKEASSWCQSSNDVSILPPPEEPMPPTLEPKDPSMVPPPLYDPNRA